MKLGARLAVLCVLAALGGCFRATVRSGHPPGQVPDGYDERWHHGFVGGLIQASGTHELDRLCPDGWAEVRVKTDPLQSLLTLITTTIYSPQGVTVVCRETEPQRPAPSASTYPPPPASGVGPLPSAERF